jgi:superfamily II DNA or RNA helicase
MTINRFSSRRQQLDRTFLCDRLQNAQSYDRIAGYFSSSMLEVAGEAINSMTGMVRVICNSDLNVRDVEAAKSAANYALRREWCASEPEQKLLNGHEGGKDRFAKLHKLLRSGKMEVKVLPRDKFGLVHGKAGVITLADGRQTSFIGSTNETYHAWKLHYELLWEDDAPEAVQWVQEEFNSLWNHPLAVPLADFVIEDIGRISQRTVIPSIEAWRELEDPIAQAGATIVETPVYRQEYGLWEHQKYFVNLAFQAHQKSHGARYILADMVGLGKTVQLAMSAMLMALYGDKPILILAPKPLLWQWQKEMKTLLDLPSAVWNGKQWVDENGLDYPAIGSEGIKDCPRRIGLVSQGIITSKSEAAEHLKQLKYECVIVDESHRARRENLADGCEKEACEPNNLLRFLFEISPRTKSLLLATATPVQLNPVEAWDLLQVLAQENEMVLGNAWSNWRNAEGALAMAREYINKQKSSEFADKITQEESILLEKFIQSLKVEQDNDPKYTVVKELLIDRGWLDLGCIIFSQYFDSVWWLANQLTRDLSPQELIGIYAGGQKSGHIRNGLYTRCDRENLKEMVQSGEIRLLLGTDAASEGLNLQRLGTLINLDLPWNPTRLEQRKGRIQRIGQNRETVYVYNMRYKGSVEDRVRDLLSDRLQSIHQMFGQIPDTLQTIWIDEALGDREVAKQTIDKFPEQHPFEMKYNQIQNKVNWESCTQVLDSSDRKQALLKSW